MSPRSHLNLVDQLTKMYLQRSFADQPIDELREDRRQGQWQRRKSVDLGSAAPRA